MADRTNRRDVVLDGAARLFATKGVAATTVREIAESAGMLSGSLYHHFESKDAIVDELLRGYLDDLQASYAEVARQDVDARTRVELLIHVSMQVVEAHPYVTEIYQNDFNLLNKQPRFAYLRTSATQIRKVWLEALTDGSDSGVFRDDIDPRTLYRIIREMVWLSVRWQRPAHNPDLSAVADACASVLLDGISVRRATKRRAPTGV
jgi:AcrR family transcriptional regulator